VGNYENYKAEVQPLIDERAAEIAKIKEYMRTKDEVLSEISKLQTELAK